MWDSRGNPTVEVEVRLACGNFGRGIAPAGASRGTREAIDLRDGGKALRGMDVQRALTSVQDKIAPALLGQDATDQAGIDATILALDPSPLKDALGGNATVATSIAVLHAAAARPLWRHIADHYGQTPTLPLPESRFSVAAHMQVGASIFRISWSWCRVPRLLTR